MREIPITAAIATTATTTDLRAGFVVTARANGAALADLLVVTQHRDVSSLGPYLGDAKAADDDPLRGVL